MNTIVKFEITTKDLVAALTVYGFRNLAKEISDEYHLLENPKKFYQAVQWSQKTIKNAGYWADERDSNLITELENVLQLLVQSRKKFSCPSGNQVLKIHYIDSQNSLIQRVEDDQHVFYSYDNINGYFDLLCQFYKLDPNVENNISELAAITVKRELYEELLNAQPEELEKLKQDDQANPILKQMLQDLQKNQQRFYENAFIDIDYVNDKKYKDHFIYSLPGDGIMWFLHFEKGPKNEVSIVPKPFLEYFQEIDESIKDFFSQPIEKAEKTRTLNRKKFSVKRGFRFLYKSNLILLGMILIMFVNHKSWIDDGAIMLILFIMLYESFTIVLFFIACLKPRFQRHNSF